MHGKRTAMAMNNFSFPRNGRHARTSSVPFAVTKPAATRALNRLYVGLGLLRSPLISRPARSG